MWYAAFDAMALEIVATSGLPRERIESDIQAVFRQYGTSEYANVIEETQCLVDLHPGESLSEVYADAVQAKRAAREAALTLCPGVWETLLELKQRGVQGSPPSGGRASFSAPVYDMSHQSPSQGHRRTAEGR